MKKLNATLIEIQEFLQNNNCEYDKSEVIQQCINNVPNVNYNLFDELNIISTFNGETVMDLETYTNELFDNFIKLVYNVIESYKD